MSCDTDVIVQTTALVVDVSTAETVVVDSSSVPIVVELEVIELVCQIEVVDSIIVEVGIPGPQGPIGPQGPQGDPGVGLPVTDMRVNVRLDGAIDGANKTYTLPNGETAVDLSASGSATINTYYNGKRLEHGLLNDFTITESGGVGTGFDTITFTASRPAPRPGDKVTADWVIQTP